MKNFKLLLFTLVNLFFLIGMLNASIYNQDGDFSINVDSLKQQIYNDNINANFKFTINNTKSIAQSFKIIIPDQSGWNINLNYNNFVLNPNEQKEISLDFVANNNFDYSNNVVSPNVVQISQKEDYTGSFDFPITVTGSNQDISLKFNVNIQKKSLVPLLFTTKVSTEPLSPISPLQYSIKGENIFDNTEIFVRIELGNIVLKEFSDIFSSNNNFKFYQEKITSDLDPGQYNSRITIRIPQKDSKSVMEWNEDSVITIIGYENIVSTKTQSSSFFKDVISIKLKNEGNLNSNYVESFEIGSFKSFLIGSNTKFDRNSGKILYNVSLAKGEEKTIEYSVNYISLYIILIVIIVLLSYIYLRKNSNPLDIETNIYEIKKIVHEGVKDMKIKIGFENIKESEIEDLKVIFRMPSYLNIKENSFSLTEPNHVLKGTKQYKLIWNFKRFEKEDSRILGFSLVNPRGILGDIKLPDLEIEVKVRGKIRRYYKSFPTIRG